MNVKRYDSVVHVYFVQETALPQLLKSSCTVIMTTNRIAVDAVTNYGSVVILTTFEMALKTYNEVTTPRGFDTQLVAILVKVISSKHHHKSISLSHIRTYEKS